MVQDLDLEFYFHHITAVNMNVTMRIFPFYKRKSPNEPHGEFGPHKALAQTLHLTFKIHHKIQQGMVA